MCSSVRQALLPGGSPLLCKVVSYYDQRAYSKLERTSRIGATNANKSHLLQSCKIPFSRASRSVFQIHSFKSLVLCKDRQH